MENVNKQLLDAVSSLVDGGAFDLTDSPKSLIASLRRIVDSAKQAAAEQAQQDEPVAHVKIGNHAPIVLGSDGLRIEGTPSGALKVTCTREHAPSVDVENAAQSNRITDEQLAADGYLNATTSAQKGGA